MTTGWTASNDTEMAKKKSRKQVASRPASKPQEFNPGRYYRHNKKQIQKVLVYAIVAVTVLSVVWGIYALIINRGVTLTKDEYVALARGHLLRGSYDQAVLNYHKALNADPNDKLIQREHFLARSRDNMSRGSTVDLVLAAAQQLLSDFPTSLVGRVSLAQAFQLRSDLSGMVREGTAARRQAQAEGDMAALLAADLVMGTYYRTEEKQDSAFMVGKEALAAANAINDTFQVALVQAGLGFAAIRLDSMQYAREVFGELLNYEGEAAASFHNVANTGLVDYYHRSKQLDSARVTLDKLRQIIDGGGADATTAYAVQMSGRLLRDSGQLDSAAIQLERSLAIWRNLQSGADVIDNLNDLGSAYRLKQDFYNARKCYMAAGTLAAKFKFDGKDLYTANLNLLFLQELKPDEYVRSGADGKTWAEEFAGK